ncbi:MAG: hypothetical protein M9894_14850 [Planctomycetes bacterium]|nr:hypothetical protein [Planctomycetota bacterium]
MERLDGRDVPHEVVGRLAGLTEQVIDVGGVIGRRRLVGGEPGDELAIGARGDLRLLGATGAQAGHQGFEDAHQ